MQPPARRELQHVVNMRHVKHTVLMIEYLEIDLVKSATPVAHTSTLPRVSKYYIHLLQSKII